VREETISESDDLISGRKSVAEGRFPTASTGTRVEDGSALLSAVDHLGFFKAFLVEISKPGITMVLARDVHCTEDIFMDIHRACIEASVSLRVIDLYT